MVLAVSAVPAVVNRLDTREASARGSELFVRLTPRLSSIIPYNLIRSSDARGSGGTADAHGLEPCAERRGGSSPPFRIGIHRKHKFIEEGRPHSPCLLT